MFLFFIIVLFDTGSPLFKQERVGKGKKPFKLLKFRSMHINAQSVATHWVQSSVITKCGSVLRKSKLDKLPQLINVLIGDISFVDPRHNLFNPNDLIEVREVFRY
jgi:O-antigen biosynthesis protein WbqP